MRSCTDERWCHSVENVTIPNNALQTLTANVVPLTTAEVAQRLATDGPNELADAQSHGLYRLVLDSLREPMFLLLIACIVAYLLVGELADGALLAPFVVLIIGMTVYQRRRTENALGALKELSAPLASVLRDGTEQRILARDLVRDDVLLVTEGDRIAADAAIIECSNAVVDESLLTGESVAVDKMATAVAADPRATQLFAGTLLVRGRVTARVTATGSRTEIGRIGLTLQSISPESTPLQKEIGQLVWQFAIGGAALCAAAFVLYGVLRGEWRDGLIAGLTMAMAMVPEEFPAVLAIFTALAAWQMSQHKVLARQPSAVEGLSAVTVLCADKTGTLTRNRMRVAWLLTPTRLFQVEADKQALPDALHELVEFAMLASQPRPTDPMDTALHELFSQHLTNTDHAHGDWSAVREYALDHGLLATSQIWHAADRARYIVATKGAPEAIADVCHFDTQRRDLLNQEVSMLATKGLRVLAVARSDWPQARLPENQHDFDFRFIGLVAFEDPVRPRVKESIAQCRAAGIRVIMITGDYPLTASAIARQLNIDKPDTVLTGKDVESMPPNVLAERLKETSVFARIAPLQKLQIVELLKSQGHIVAMTGDGVNDAPALRSAHAGLAMGKRGTDVAREAAALVIVDDDFSSIVDGLAIGRRVFDNLRKAARFIFAAHIPIAALSLAPILFGWPLVLLPAHIAFLELIIDPTCSLAFAAEPAEPNLMQRPPRRVTERLITSRSVVACVIQGLIAFAGVLAMLLWARHLHYSEDAVRSVAFVTLVFVNLALIIASRDLGRGTLAALTTVNSTLWKVFAGALGLLAAIFSISPLRRVFQFAVIPASDWVLCATTALLAGVAISLVSKWIANR
jgi:P-type Ca2+ transporter type 2C